MVLSTSSCLLCQVADYFVAVFHEVLQAVNACDRLIYSAGYCTLLVTVHAYLQVSEPLVAQVHDCFHLKDTLGSDHCPVGLVLKTQAEV